MQITIQTEFPAIAKRLAQLESSVRDKALASTLNKTIAQAKTRMQREIVREYNVTPAYVRERLQVRRATAAASRLKLQAELVGGNGKKRSANLIRFLERSVSLAQARRRAKDGTLRQLRFKVRRSGGPQTIAGAFIGNRGRTVFRRVGKERLPIKAVSTIDVPQMFNQRRINAAVVQSMRENFTRIFDAEAAFYVARFNATR